MKLCIYQLAFIAVIVFCSKFTHSYHEHLAKVSGYHLHDLTEQIDSLVDELIKESTMAEKLHEHIQGLDDKDKNLNGKERSSVKDALSQASNNLVRKRQQVERSHHYLEKSKELLVSAVNLIKSGNQKTRDALSNVREVRKTSNQRIKNGLSKEHSASLKKRDLKKNKYNTSGIVETVLV